MPISAKNGGSISSACRIREHRRWQQKLLQYYTLRRTRHRAQCSIAVCIGGGGQLVWVFCLSPSVIGRPALPGTVALVFFRRHDSRSTAATSPLDRLPEEPQWSSASRHQDCAAVGVCDSHRDKSRRRFIANCSLRGTSPRSGHFRLIAPRSFPLHYITVSPHRRSVSVCAVAEAMYGSNLRCQSMSHTLLRQESTILLHWVTRITSAIQTDSRTFHKNRATASHITTRGRKV